MEVHALSALSSDDSSKSSFLAGASDRPDPFLQEPRKPPDYPFDCQRFRDLGPIDSGCNLPLTNPSTVQHFKLEQHLWDSPKWIKFGNESGNVPLTMPTSVPSLAKVASALDTLISVSVLCPKGLEVSFKYTERPAIYLQGKLIHQGTFDHSNKMFYTSIFVIC